MNYEVLSSEAVSEMHAHFMRRLESRVKKAAPPAEKLTEEKRKQLVNFLLKAARVRLDISNALLTHMIRHQETLRAEENVVEHMGKSAPLSAQWREKMEKSHKKRKEAPAVRKIFGDADRIYLRFNPEYFEHYGVKNIDGYAAGHGQAVERGRTHQTLRDVTRYIGSKGYHVTDYQGGYATDRKKKQKFRIGKLLKDNPDLLKAFEHDSLRTENELMVVVSRRAEDIALMSTGRAWHSCMTLKKKNKSTTRSIPGEIREGSLVAYLVSAKDPDVLNPLGRILLKPYRQTMLSRVFGRGKKPEDKDRPRTVFNPGPAYGLSNLGFQNTVGNFINALNENAKGVFKIARGSYLDKNMERKIALEPWTPGYG